MSWHTPSTDLGSHICIKLINLVKQHPSIYLTSKEQSPQPRKTRTEINQIWDDIARDVGLSVEDCKRRWKGLKDVYAKIRKRRLQEGVLGIKPRKKWLYEDFMSFMKFSFEQSYQKALENFEEVDCNEWKLDDAESNDTGEDTLIDDSDRLALMESKIEEEDLKIEDPDTMEDGTIEYLDLDLEVDSVPDSEGYDSIKSLEKDDGCENKTPKVFTLQENTVLCTETIPKSRYRAIRPKPYQPNIMSKTRSARNRNVIVQNSANCTNPVVNVSSLKPLNQIIVTSPTTLQKGNNCDTVILGSSDMKVKSFVKESNDNVSSTSPIAMKIVGSPSPNTSNRSESQLRLLSNNNISSVELFFQSMAQTVLNLPMRAQAEIKMEICKIVTKAELQYSLSQSTSKVETRSTKGRKG